MKIAVINEVSAREKNEFIIKGLETTGVEIFNVGMTAESSETELTYIHTGLMAGISLATKAADFVVGGCGTGQGFLISSMQYPGVYCGLITSSLDAWLFSQINGGNCISLALNKGFGWAGDIDLRYIFEKLFSDPPGQGYPPNRSESQKNSRQILAKINAVTHKDFKTILKEIDPEVLKCISGHAPFIDFIQECSTQRDLIDYIIK